MRGIFKVFIVFVLFFLAGCGDMKSEKKLVVATSADFPPYVFKDKEGKIDGIDIEIVKDIAKRLKLDLEIKDMPFDSIINSVASNQADIGINAITVIEERKESVNFSITYDKSKQAIVVKENGKIKNINDLYNKNAKYKVGVQSSTTGALYFKNDIANKNLASTVKEYQNGLDIEPELLAGNIDCIIIDMEQARTFIEKNKGLKILETEYVEEEYAIVVNKNKIPLLSAINKALTHMKMDGTIKNILAKYKN